MLQSALSYTHSLIRQVVKQGDTVIDATVGNGHDTLLLAEIVGETGCVIGFDIQKAAIETTQKKIDAANWESRVKLYHKGHEKINDVLPASTHISLAVYNLGYLPSGDKSIITTPQTTIQSIEQALAQLRKKGLVLLMIYYGHKGGQQEKEAVLHFVEQLPQADYSVLSYKFINQQNSPPLLIAIEKR